MANNRNEYMDEEFELEFESCSFGVHDEVKPGHTLRAKKKGEPTKESMLVFAYNIDEHKVAAVLVDFTYPGDTRPNLKGTVNGEEYYLRLDHILWSDSHKYDNHQ